MRILIVQSRSILVAGLISLLHEEECFDVESTIYKNKKHLQTEINRYQPEVVIIDACLSKSKISTMLTFLESQPQIRILVVSLRESQIQIYEKQNREVNYIDDLIKIIQGEAIVQRD